MHESGPSTFCNTTNPFIRPKIKTARKRWCSICREGGVNLESFLGGDGISSLIVCLKSCMVPNARPLQLCLASDFQGSILNEVGGIFIRNDAPQMCLRNEISGCGIEALRISHQFATSCRIHNCVKASRQSIQQQCDFLNTFKNLHTFNRHHCMPWYHFISQNWKS